MVVTANRRASEAGAAILRAGGNAVDAAVAVGYALAVVDPCCGNIGGGGFMTLRLADGRTRFIDFRETAPAVATRDMYLDAQGNVIPESSWIGWRAVAVPGTVLGLDTALARYGTMTRAQVMAPAIVLARDGFTLSAPEAALLGRLAGRGPDAAPYLRADGTPLREGERLVQPLLADTLGAVAANGPDAFYRGHIPAAIEADARAHGGVITAADFAAYRVEESEPLRCEYRGWAILSAPPPSSGGVTLCEILNILSGYDLAAFGYHSAASAHVMIEAMRHAFLDRNFDLGDPDFVRNPVERLLSPDYAAEIRAKIGPRAAASAELWPGLPPHERPQTTHYSVMDRAGNAVAVTYTLNGFFGAGVMAPGAGFLLNDEMDDFTLKPGAANMFGLVQGEANAIAPGKRPLSSMAPTIALHDGEVAMVLGSPGGPRIITTVLEVVLNVIDYGMAPQEAVDAPRLHMQYMPDEVFLEPRALSPDTAAILRDLGYRLTTQTPWGAAETIVVGPPRPAADAASAGNDAAVSTRMRPGLLYGASDPRRPQGAAIGN
jgi:gamma-glutamyltranspeptidase / glutathione hydrolase